MTPKKDPLAVRAARGEYDLVVPLDYKILDELQPEGTTLAGMYEIGTTVKEIMAKYPVLTSGTISTRLRLLAEQGLAQRIKLIGGGKGTVGGHWSWQRTAKGEEILKGWKEVDGVNG